VDRQDIAWRDEDREWFLRLVGRRSSRHGVAVLAYAMMSNHYHLVVDITDGDLPSMMREFQSEYSKHINARLGRTGPLFERRYTSVPVMSDAQLAVTVRYVHRNPIDIVGTRGLVSYRWSSLGPVVKARTGPGWLRIDQLERRLELSSHLSFVECPLPSDRRPFRWIPPQRRTTLAEILDAVDTVAAGPAIRRAAVVLLSAELRAAEPATVAAHFVCSEKTVRNIRSNAKGALAEDPEFVDAVQKAMAILG